MAENMRLRRLPDARDDEVQPVVRDEGNVPERADQAHEPLEPKETFELPPYIYVRNAEGL